MLECVRYREWNGNEIVKRENDGKESLVKNCRDILSLILQIMLKMLNPNMGFGLHYNLNQFHYGPPNKPCNVVLLYNSLVCPATLVMHQMDLCTVSYT